MSEVLYRMSVSRYRILLMLQVWLYRKYRHGDVRSGACNVTRWWSTEERTAIKVSYFTEVLILHTPVITRRMLNLLQGTRFRIYVLFIRAILSRMGLVDGRQPNFLQKACVHLCYRLHASLLSTDSQSKTGGKCWRGDFRQHPDRTSSAYHPRFALRRSWLQISAYRPTISTHVIV
jgi:hypothetical protein